ncbi:MAG TPA: DUF2252 family protein [Kofleriaceae bacterium]
MNRWLTGAGILALAACDTGADRAAWLAGTLALDNQAQLEHAPHEVAGKLAKMARDPFSFMRGSGRQLLRDLADHPAWSQPTAFADPASSLVLLVGDPHPENIGVYRAGGELRADWNDFDASFHGPFHLDVRRLAVSLAVMARLVAPDNAGLGRALAEEAATAYGEEMMSLDAGGDPFRARAADGEVIEDLLEHAAEDGAERIELLRYTAISSGRRAMIYGDIAPPEEEVGYAVDRLVRLDDAERALVHALLATYPDSLVGSAPPAGFFAVKGMARELGVGVASYALARFLVLVEGPSDSVADDRLLELKEEPAGLALAGQPVLPFPLYGSDAERVVAATRALQEDAAADPLLGWAVSGRLSVRVRELSGYQRQLDVDRFVRQLAEGDWSVGDVLDFATVCGRLLARAHGLGRTADGAIGHEVIAPVVARDPGGFSAETADFAAAYVEQVVDDRDLLIELLEARGPLLGWGRP